MKIYLIIIITLTFIFSSNGQKPVRTITTPGDKAAQPDSRPDLIGLTGQAPMFTGLSMDGAQYKLEELKGKIVVINLWGTFCEPCIEEMPRLNALVDKYKDKPVVFLAPSADTKDVLTAFLQKNPFKYTVLPNSFGIIRQYAPQKKGSPSLPNQFMMILPTHLVIDQSGKVTTHFWGYGETTADKLAKNIDDLLARKE